jgi:hypothetical protein
MPVYARSVDGKALVRLAKLRGRIAALARGGRFDITGRLLGELVRADLALGLPADGLRRARQAVELAREREDGAPVAATLVTLAATSLAADLHASAIDAAAAAIEAAGPEERARIEASARLVGGAAQRRLGHLREARLLLDAARGTAARLGESAIAGLALAELARIDLAEDRPPAAAVCFEFSGEFLRRAGRRDAAVEADALAIAAWAVAGELATATDRAPEVSDAARELGRLDLVAYVDAVVADLAVTSARDAAAEACALAAESALAIAASPIGRELTAAARLRQARVASDAADRARHLEAGLELARSLPADRASGLLGTILVALVEDAVREDRRPDPDELAGVAAAIASIDDPDLAELARAMLADVA